MRSDNDTWDITTSVGSTALFAAAARALEAQRPEPLARDPHAEIYCRAAGGEWADVVEGKATSSRSKLLLETEFGKHFVSFQALGPGAVAQVVCEVGSGLNDKRPTLRQILSDPSATVVGVGHRDRLARFGVEYLEAALSAQGRRVVVADLGETAEDLVRDVIEVLTSMCTRSYGRRGARNRAMRALTAARRERGDG